MTSILFFVQIMRKSTPQAIVLMPKKERTLTPGAYLADIKRHKDLINNVQFVPPKLGSKGFGSFLVQYDTFVLVDAS